MHRGPPRSHRLHHSFPTRRPSDLSWTKATSRGWMTTTPAAEFRNLRQSAMRLGRLLLSGAVAALVACALPAAGQADDGLRAPRLPALDNLAAGPGAWRSEEHTSELQSLMRISYAVFC